MNKKAWIVSLTAIFGGIALAMVQNKVSPVMTILMDTFGISMNTAGLLSTIFCVMGMVVALPAAIVLNKLGPKMAGLISLVCAILGSLLGVLTSNITILILSRVIEGAGVGIIAVLAPALISMWFPIEKRGFPMGIWGAWMMVSQTVLFLISSPITNAMGWQGMWWFGLICCAVAALLFLFFVSTPPEGQNYAGSDNDDVRIKEGVKSRSSWMLAIAAMCFTFCSFTFVSWISPYWSGQTGWSLDTTQLWISLLYFVEIIYAVIVGFILNKVKNRKGMGAIGFIVYAALGLAAFYIGSAPLVIAMVFIFPIFDALIPCIMWAIGPQTAKSPMYTGIALGILNIGLNLGTLLSAPVSGLLVENFGWSSAGILFAVAAVIGGFFLSRVKMNFGE
jgi:predicted MFS family arabinose efflux permease